MDIIYRSIVKQLQEKLEDNVKWIDLDSGQLEWPDESYPVHFPCILIDFPGIQYKSLQLGIQEGSMILQFRLVFDVYEDYNGESPNLEAACEHLKLVNEVHAALHGFSGRILPVLDENNEVTDYEDKHFNRLQRIDLSTEKREDGLKVITMTYRTTITDVYASPNWTQTNVEKLTITNEIES